ncbi:MAG: glycosyltransferase [Ignavibacteriales bacterium]|nr:glycosyltransferase [Ignavibacteriales bacterium]
MNDRLPLVSIITICFNAARSVRQTIESVLHQSYKNIEYIIVDGGSTDGTLDIVREYGAKITKVISEPDKGISDAFNKGIRQSSGEYIQFIHADDRLEGTKIEKSVTLLNTKPDIGFVFGDVHKIHSGKIEIVPGDAKYARSIRYVMGRINHPTVMVRKIIFDSYGVFDLEWKIAMDYDWHLRIHQKGIRGIYSPELLVYTTAGGISDNRRFRAFAECRDISILHGLHPFFAYGYFFLRCSKHIAFKLAGLR